MTMLPASLALGGLINSNGVYKRWQLGSQNAVQIYGKGAMVWSTKDVILRKPPYTINEPTAGQADVRRQFGITAQGFKGDTGTINGLPAVAFDMQQNFHYKSPFSLPPEQYESRSRHTLHTLEQLQAMIEKKKTSTVPAMSQARVLRVIK